jgi:hypothetical protein
MKRLALLLALALAGCGAKPPTLAEPTRACPVPAPSGEVALKGGTFVLGARPEHDDEGPPQTVTVAPFSIDRTEVTNAQFAAFVAATGYVTLAERQPDPALYPGVPADRLKPSSLVFVGAKALGSGDPSLWWRVVDGASWKHPEGPGSDLKGRERHPVVQVAYDDALAYARWKGRDLPTEAEWEFAARAGLDGARYEWGDDKPAPGQPKRQQLAGGVPGHRHRRRRLQGPHRAGRLLPGQRLWPVRHDRQRLGVDQGLLRVADPQRPDPPDQGRLVPLRRQLLLSLPAERAPAGPAGYGDQPCGVPDGEAGGEWTLIRGQLTYFHRRRRQRSGNR